MNGRNCGDCGGQLERISIMDQRNSWEDALEYRSVEAERNFWGAYPVRGTIIALACTDCRRVYLYAAEYENPKKRKLLSDPNKAGRLSLSQSAGGLSTPEDEAE
jgi:hypothetical protein